MSVTGLGRGRCWRRTQVRTFLQFCFCLSLNILVTQKVRWCCCSYLHKYWCSHVIPYLYQFLYFMIFFRARQCEARNQDKSAHCSPLHTTILRPLSEEDHLARLGVPRQVPWHFRQTPMYLSCWRDRVWENYTNPSMVSSKNSIIFVIYVVQQCLKDFDLIYIVPFPV